MCHEKVDSFLNLFWALLVFLLTKIFCFFDVYVMCKVQIGTILGLPCANLGSELCVINPRIVHILAHALFPVCHMYANWTIAHRCRRATAENPFPIDKEGRSKFLTLELVCLKSMYRNAVFANRVWLLSVIFDRVSQLPSYAQKRSIIDNMVYRGYSATCRNE